MHSGWAPQRKYQQQSAHDFPGSDSAWPREAPAMSTAPPCSSTPGNPPGPLCLRSKEPQRAAKILTARSCREARTKAGPDPGSGPADRGGCNPTALAGKSRARRWRRALRPPPGGGEAAAAPEAAAAAAATWAPAVQSPSPAASSPFLPRTEGPTRPPRYELDFSPRPLPMRRGGESQDLDRLCARAPGNQRRD